MEDSSCLAGSKYCTYWVTGNVVVRVLFNVLVTWGNFEVAVAVKVLLNVLVT
jgi:hypothetical protein